MSNSTPTFDNSIEFKRSNAQKLIVMLLDISGSMAVNGKLEAENNAVKTTCTALKDLQNANPQVKLMIRRLAFGATAGWVDPQAMDISCFQPTDLSADGGTATGDAVRLCASFLQSQSGTLNRNAGLILLSDGQPNSPSDYDQALQEAMQIPAFKKADRLAISIGADADQASLKKFASPEFPLLFANNPEQLVQYLRMASVMLVTGNEPGMLAGNLESIDDSPSNPAMCESIIW